MGLKTCSGMQGFKNILPLPLLKQVPQNDLINQDRGRDRTKKCRTNTGDSQENFPEQQQIALGRSPRTEREKENNYLMYIYIWKIIDACFASFLTSVQTQTLNKALLGDMKGPRREKRVTLNDGVTVNPSCHMFDCDMSKTYTYCIESLRFWAVACYSG